MVSTRSSTGSLPQANRTTRVAAVAVAGRARLVAARGPVVARPPPVAARAPTGRAAAPVQADPVLPRPEFFAIGPTVSDLAHQKERTLLFYLAARTEVPQADWVDQYIVTIDRKTEDGAGEPLARGLQGWARLKWDTLEWHALLDGYAQTRGNFIPPASSRLEAFKVTEDLRIRSICSAVVYFHERHQAISVALNNIALITLPAAANPLRTLEHIDLIAGLLRVVPLSGPAWNEDVGRALRMFRSRVQPGDGRTIFHVRQDLEVSEVMKREHDALVRRHGEWVSHLELSEDTGAILARHGFTSR